MHIQTKTVRRFNLVLLSSVRQSENFALLLQVTVWTRGQKQWLRMRQATLTKLT